MGAEDWRLGILEQDAAADNALEEHEFLGGERMGCCPRNVPMELRKQ